MSDHFDVALDGVSLEASLTVKDVSQSAAWYVTVLGFAEDRRYEREGRVLAVALKASAVRILLTQDDGSKGLDRDKGAGMSLQISTHQSADALADRVRHHGGTIDMEPVTMPHGARVVRLRDPDGFRFAISSTTAP